MQKSAAEHRSTSATKRKLSHQSPPSTNNCATQSQSRQSKLTELFSNSDLALGPTATDGPYEKRLKSGQMSKPYKSKVLRPEATVTEKKISSSSRTPQKPDVVDLTDSLSPSPSSPRHGATTSNGLISPAKFQPYTGVKRLVIKNLRSPPKTSSEEVLERIWTQLDVSLTAIFSGSKLPYSMEELYRGVENVCRQHRAPELFEKLKSRCQEYLQVTVKGHLLEDTQIERGNVEVLHSMLTAWTKWNTYLLTIRSIFFFLDRSYLLSSNGQPTINDMGISQFRRFIFLEPTLKTKVSQAACDLIDGERRNSRELNDSSLLRESIKMMHALGVYGTEFEPRFLEASAQYFEQWAEENGTELILADYIEQCARLIEKEMERCDLLHLDFSTRRDLLAQLEESLVTQKVDILINTQDIFKLLDGMVSTALDLLYSLLLRVNLHSWLKTPWEMYIKTVGSSIVGDEKREGEMVNRLLELKAKTDYILKNCFYSDEQLGHAARESFAAFINERRSGSSGKASNAKSGEMIAKYIDMLLRGGVKAIPRSMNPDVAMRLERGNEDLEPAVGDEDGELSRQLDRVLELFRFIEGKDVFEAFYKKDLARRLLMARSASADAERGMLSKLKNECGSAFTHNLEQMFKDIDLAKEEMGSYKEIRQGRGKQDRLDLNVNVLSSAAWPSYPDVSVTLPAEIQSAVNDFDEYYKSKHTGRNLNWKHALAHCVVKAKFARGDKDLVVSSFQAIVMLLFNAIPDGSSLSYTDIQAATGLTDAELVRTLQSLACGKYQVLKKSPKGRDVNKGDKFLVNLNFSDPKIRIKINQIQLKETKEENTATHEDVNRDRQYETQAAIVRIMKSRKNISAQELMLETITMTKKRGALDTSEIKKQIDKLIEKDYIERVVEDGRMSYNYLA